jgi:hypothetical protein
LTEGTIRKIIGIKGKSFLKPGHNLHVLKKEHGPGPCRKTLYLLFGFRKRIGRYERPKSVFNKRPKPIAFLSK